MAQQPRRKPVPLMKSPSLQRVSQNADNYAPIKDMTVPQSRSSQMLTTLNEVLPGVATDLGGEIQRIVEEDKTTQEMRAYAGLTPSEDATKAGTTAHQAVGVRNLASETVRELKAKAATFEGTQEQWEVEVAATQNQLLTQVGNDPAMVEAIGGVFREGLGQIADVRFQEVQRQDQEQKFNTQVQSFTEAVMNAPNGVVTVENITQAVAEARAMGMSTDVIKKSLVHAASNLADQNDLTLMDVTKDSEFLVAAGLMGEGEGDLFSKESVLINGEKQAHNRIDAELAGVTAQAKVDIQDKYLATPSLSMDAWRAEAGAARTPTGQPLYTEAQILAFERQLTKQRNSDFRLNELFGHIMYSERNPEADPITTVATDLTGDEKKKLINMYDEQQAAQLRAYVATESDPQKQGEFTAQLDKKKVAMLSRMGLTDPAWQTEFSTLYDFNGKELVAGENKLPVGVANALSTLDAIADSGQIDKYKNGDEALSIHANFVTNKQLGMGDVQAYQSAWSMVRDKKVTIDKDMKKAITSNVSDAVTSAFSKSWYEPGTSVGEGQRAVLQDVIRQRTESLVSIGYPVDKAATQAAKEYKGTHFQLDNGHVVRGNINELGSRMGVAPANVDKVFSELPARMTGEDDDLTDVDMEAFILNPIAPPEDWQPVIHPNGTVTFEAYGVQVTKPMTLEEIGGKSIAAQVEDQKNKEADTTARREKMAKEGRFWPTPPDTSSNNNWSHWRGNPKAMQQ